MEVPDAVGAVIGGRQPVTPRLQTFTHQHPQGTDIGDYVRFVLVLAAQDDDRILTVTKSSLTPTGREQCAECRHGHEPSTSSARCSPRSEPDAPGHAPGSDIPLDERRTGVARAAISREHSRASRSATAAQTGGQTLPLEVNEADHGVVDDGSMTYSSRNWWIEMAVFVSVTAVCTVLLVLLWIWSLDGAEASANVWGFVVPGALVGLWASRRYRRAHIS
ncbi:hypothetical protein ACIQFZ_41080 [Streptomyces sp. NPDC093064]|uniref:hypothetical protein n=1 Tax=Streptomyces sp. NPDC093064 TaxID=3366020 RepID=UPI003800F3BA